MSPSSEPSRVGVLLSGRGSNFIALHEAMAAGEVPAKIVLVVSNKPNAPGLERARRLGIPTFSLPHKGLTREEHEGKLIEELEKARVDWVCLAGYMRLLSPRFIQAFANRMLNIHPSLLPSFPGLDAQRQAWDYGVEVSGCTVHLVDEGLDSGPIVLQRAVSLEGAVNAEETASRILAVEHRAYAQALRRVLKRDWRIEGRRVVFSGSERNLEKDEKKT